MYLLLPPIILLFVSGYEICVHLVIDNVIMRMRKSSAWHLYISAKRFVMFTFSAELDQEMSKPSQPLANFKVAQFDKLSHLNKSVLNVWKVLHNAEAIPVQIPSKRRYSTNKNSSIRDDRTACSQGMSNAKGTGQMKTMLSAVRNFHDPKKEAEYISISIWDCTL